MSASTSSRRLTAFAASSVKAAPRSVRRAGTDGGGSVRATADAGGDRSASGVGIMHALSEATLLVLPATSAGARLVSTDLVRPRRSLRGCGGVSSRASPCIPRRGVTGNGRAMTEKRGGWDSPRRRLGVDESRLQGSYRSGAMGLGRSAPSHRSRGRPECARGPTRRQTSCPPLEAARSAARKQP